MVMNKIRSNIIPQAITRDVQRQTLKVIADAVSSSFGPNGSTTAITQYTNSSLTNVSVTHTKDGHTIVKNLQFVNPIERSVQDLISDMTRYIVKEVGDGTSSACILASELFNTMCSVVFDDAQSPADIIRRFKKCISEINERILSRGKECTLDDVYNICLIATNNNVDITDTLFQIYKKYGIDVYIDVNVSPEKENIVKEYEGMTLETGYSDICFVNDKSNNTARVQNARIYAFEDPIDTPEMLRFLDIILEHNILRAYRAPTSPQMGKYEPIPTVILSKKITPDASSHLETIVKLMNQYPGAVPLLIVSDIHQNYLYEDIVQMCGCKWIKKYIDPDQQKIDQDAGYAPTEETICDFYGSASEVRSDQLKTQFIHPAAMFNEDGSYSDKYNMMVNYLSSQINKLKSEGAGINEIATAKRRYNSFKGNMVDFLIGGVTLSDRDNLKASVEDAVLNVRSSVANGIGYGANFMAYSVITEMLSEDKYKNNPYLKMLKKAYYNLLTILYNSSFPGQADVIIEESIENGCPLNIRTNEYDKKVLSSIRSDIVILETIDKILTMMYTTNQYLLPSPAISAYENWSITTDED